VTEGKIHVASVREDINLFAYGVQWFYYLLIAGIILFAAGMIALDQYRHRVVDPRRRGHGHA
jgi:ABC-type polysaccharide/polyol phosphate export permease